MLAELWGIEWLFWWQLVLLPAMLGLLVFGGGALLWVGGRFCAHLPKATFWRSIVANVLALVAALGTYVLVACVLGMIGGPLGMIVGMFLGTGAGLLVCWLVIKAVFATSLPKAMLAWLPSLGQGVYLGPCLAGALVPTLQQANELTNRTVCVSNLSSIGKAIVLYQGTNDGRMPPSLDALIAEGHPRKLLTCPSAGRGVRPAGQAHDYFYLPAPRDAGDGRIIACDFWVNHRGKQRNVLYADMSVGRMTEADFQAELAKPRNADFAAALRAAEGP